MSEFENGTYQSTEQVETNETPIQQELTQNQEPVTTQEPQFFELKYNKEPVKVSYDEAPTYIQKGLNYDKVYQQSQEYKQDLELFSDLTGIPFDELRQRALEAKQQQQLQRYEEAGINPDVLNQFLSSHPDIQYAKEMRAREQEQQQIKSEVDQLRERFPDLQASELTDELFQLREQRNIPLLHAYLEMNFSKLAQQKEQEAIQKIQNNAVTSPGSLGGGDVSHTTNIKNLSSNDFNSLVDQVLRGERKQL
jgi:hypothetical protein